MMYDFPPEYDYLTAKRNEDWLLDQMKLLS